MNRAIRWATVLLFLVILVAPFLQSAFSIFHIPVLHENRRRASRPTFSWKGVLAGDAPYGKKYEKYFDDHFGFRDLLIRTKHQIDFSLFNRSDEILIGKDGNLFFRDVEKYQLDQDLEWEGSKRQLWKNLHDLHDFFAEKGILFVTVPLPNKNTLYPELVAPWAIRRPKDTAFHQLRDMLAKGDLPWVDGYRVLADHRPEGALFHRTDFHWNDVGAAHVGKAIVDELGKRTGTGTRWEVPIDRVSLRNFSGNQSLALGLFHPPTEDTWVSPPRLAERSRCKAPEGWYLYSCAARPSQPGPLLPPTVVVGDSFGEQFRTTDFPAHFSAIRHMRYTDMRAHLSDIPADTKVILFEFQETGLIFMQRDPDRLKLWPDISRPISLGSEGPVLTDPLLIRPVYVDVEAPESVGAGQSFEVAFGVRNNGTQTWPAHTKAPLRFGYHWADPEGQGNWNSVVWDDGTRASLTADVPPGGSARLTMTVKALPKASPGCKLIVAPVIDGLAKSGWHTEHVHVTTVDITK